MYEHKSGIMLRKIERDDLPKLLNLKNESWWGTHKVLFLNQEDQVNWFDNIPDNQLYMIACHKKMLWEGWEWEEAGVAVYTDIDHFNRTLNISGSIFEECRSLSGVVKRAFSAGLDFAFEMLNMRRVQAEVLSCNAAARNLEVNHLGFNVEGTRREAVYKAGVYYDSLMLGLLREEWEQQERIKKYKGSCCQFDHEKAMRAAAKCKKLYG